MRSKIDQNANALCSTCRSGCDRGQPGGVPQEAGQHAKLYQSAFAFKNHQIYMIDRAKSTISSYDDKRYWLDNNVQSVPYGHYRIEEIAAA